MSGKVTTEDNILVQILADKQVEVRERASLLPLDELRGRCVDMGPTRGFADRIRNRVAAGDPAVIAEVKRASPSRGLIRENFVPADIAVSYRAGGACCLSVLTDEKYFQGSDQFLREARDACDLPVLRKDFTVDAYQVWEARSLGADCILLIVAALEDDRLQELSGLASTLGLDVLVEVHDAAELGRAMQLDLPMVGINNRDLKSFITSLDRTVELLPDVPEGVLVISESGIHSRDDVITLRKSGVHAFLVGEAFMRAADPGKQLSEMFF